MLNGGGDIVRVDEGDVAASPAATMTTYAAAAVGGSATRVRQPGGGSTPRENRAMRSDRTKDEDETEEERHGDAANSVGHIDAGRCRHAGEAGRTPA